MYLRRIEAVLVGRGTDEWEGRQRGHDAGAAGTGTLAYWRALCLTSPSGASACGSATRYDQPRTLLKQSERIAPAARLIHLKMACSFHRRAYAWLGMGCPVRKNQKVGRNY